MFQALNEKHVTLKVALQGNPNKWGTNQLIVLDRKIEKGNMLASTGYEQESQMHVAPFVRGMIDTVLRAISYVVENPQLL